MVNQTALLDDSPAQKFRLVAGELCLDFCNTVGGKRGEIAREKLHTYADFLAWCRQANLVSNSKWGVLTAKAKHEGDKAGCVLARAIQLRESIYGIFLSIAEGAPPKESDLALLNAELAKSMGRLRIGADASGTKFEWSWAQEPAELDDPLGPVARSAANLLATDEDLAHVRQCRGDNCGWLFIDSSKNHSRCWCDMRDCGNRAKVRRHRQKQHPI